MRSAITSRSDVMTSRALQPGAPGWDAARRAFNLAVDQRPAAIAFPRDERDVRAVVEHARERGLRVSAQATGHGAAGLAALDATILVRTAALSGVSLDPGSRRVRAGAGADWGSVVAQLSGHGLAALHGSSPNVGVAGYSLGGGMGWLARKHGLQCNSVTAIELVTADGHLLRADASHEPDLFWALRGGGGSFGVVTAIEFAVQPVPRLYAGAMFFHRRRASEVLGAWAEALPAFPDELMTWASLLHLPDAPHLPARVRGRSLAAVFGVFLGEAADGRALLAPIRRLKPEIDTFATVEPAALGDLAMDPPAPVPYESGHSLLDALPADAIDALVEAAGPALGKVQLRHTGGALGRHLPGAGALSSLPGSVAMFALGLVADQRSRAAVTATLQDVEGALRPYHAGEYASFVDRPVDAARFFDSETWRRLREVKALYDPDDLFVAAHHVPPSEPGARSHVPSRRTGPAHIGASVAPAPAPVTTRSAVVRALDDVRWGPEVAVLEGRWDGIEASLYVTTFEPGHGPHPHTHPYAEAFLVQDGIARFHAGEQQLDVSAGHFVIVAADTPHHYVSIGEGPATVISFQPSGVIVQNNI